MSRTATRPAVPVAAVAALAALAVIGLQYAIATPEEDALRELLVVCGLIAACTGIVFGLVVPRARSRGGSAGTALTLSLLGLLLAAAFWSGLPPVLAIGGIVLARRQDGTLARVALGVGVLALVADVAITIGDGVASG
jgi:hypothetical protein